MALFMGLDSSTQGLKAEIIDTDTGKIVVSEGINYGRDLPEYNCPEGTLPNEAPQVKHADPLMWVAALDLLLTRLQQAGAPLAKVAGISGSGQQHGSVYLNDSFETVLAGLEKNKELATQLADTLSRKTAPIWMDSSTGEECRELNEKFPRMQVDSGSPPIERFTGPQIRKFYKESPQDYDRTATVHLVSSFMASVLVGRNAPIDHGDAAGMNLLNLKKLDWAPEFAEFTAPGLLGKLPAAAPSNTLAGGLSDYFTKYGLRADTPVAVWSGDNPNSLIGTGAYEHGIGVISLGTSDTLFAAMSSPVTDPQGYGHVFGNPAGGFMCLICFTNGSLARERVREECAVDYKYFDTQACSETPPGNNGKLMLPYYTTECTPLVSQAGVKYSVDEEYTKAEKIRAVFESQALSLKIHSGWIGEKFSKLRITGGASKSRDFCQIIADVFQTPVEKISVTDSAGLGAALRAANAVSGISFQTLCDQFSAAGETVLPNPATAEIYAKAEQNYRKLEAQS